MWYNLKEIIQRRDFEMTLRKAELKDFAQYSALYYNSSYQVLYLSDTPGDLDNEITEKEIDFIINILGIDMESIDSKYENFSKEEFEKQLIDKKIFMLEDNGQIIGYVSLFLMKRRTYRIDELAMIFPCECDTLALQEIMADLNAMIPDAKEISVFPSNKMVKQMLYTLGFEKSRGGIYSKRA